VIEESHQAIVIPGDHQDQAQEGKHPKIMKNKRPIDDMKNLKIFQGTNTTKNLLGEKIKNNFTSMKSMNFLQSEKNRRLLRGTITAKNYQSIKIMVSLSPRNEPDNRWHQPPHIQGTKAQEPVLEGAPVMNIMRSKQVKVPQPSLSPPLTPSSRWKYNKCAKNSTPPQ
jgi:hypothetical protein